MVTPVSLSLYYMYILMSLLMPLYLYYYLLYIIILDIIIYIYIYIILAFYKAVCMGSSLVTKFVMCFHEHCLFMLLI